jgi:RloB-like protein
VQVIASFPSVEFWLLLHFEYSARPFQTSAESQQALRAYRPDYRKDDRDIFLKTAAGLVLACQWVQRLKNELRTNGAVGPDTDMHLLVEQFRRMQRP